MGKPYQGTRISKSSERIIMPVSPIDYGRYGHPDMVTIFEEKHRHSLWLSIEAAVAEVQAEMDLIPKEAAEDIKKTAKSDIVTLERTMEIEKRIREEVLDCTAKATVGLLEQAGSVNDLLKISDIVVLCVGHD